jgi:hypothetical protein
MTNLLQKCLDDSKGAEGIYAEFGVLRGATFKDIVKFAKSNGKIAYAFDSFIGMDTPTDGDGEDGKKQYPKGRFDIGGESEFKKILSGYGINENDYKTVPGYLPGTLEGFSNLKYSFARVDVDHYMPTKKILEYLLPRINKKSVVLCDDYFIKDNLASLAYKEFIEENKGEIEVISVEGREMAFRLK